MVCTKLWGFLGLNFFIDNAVLLFPTVLSLGGRSCGMGFRPLGTPFLRLDVVVACTGISTPWCHLVKPPVYIKIEITEDMLYSITNLPSQMCGEH